MVENNSLLVIHPGALGDVVLSFYALETVKRRFNSIHLLCQGQIGKIAERMKVSDRSFPIESARFADLYGRFSPWLLQWIAGYGTVLLFSVSSELESILRRHSQGAVVRIAPRPEKGLRIHTAVHLLDSLKGCGLSDPAAEMAFAGPQAADAASNTVLLHPGAGSLKKRWPAERFFDLARRIAARGMSPLFFLGPAERDLEERIRKTGWPLFVSEELSAVLDRLLAAAAFVGNDSGVSHLAAYSGIPTVAVFGPTDPRRWAPMGKAAAAVCPRDPECIPCLQSGWEDCSPRRCLDDVPVDAVFEALLGVMSPKNPKRAHYKRALAKMHAPEPKHQSAHSGGVSNKPRRWPRRGLPV